MHMNVRTPVVEWVFRHADGYLIDLPDQPIPTRPGVWRWVATVWADPLQPGGWSRLMWPDGPRGHLVVAPLTLGDVVEFGVTAPDATGASDAAVTSQWYGYLHHSTRRALVIHGPFRNPADATRAARSLVDEVLLEQLAPPAEPVDDPPPTINPRHLR